MNAINPFPFPTEISWKAAGSDHVEQDTEAPSMIIKTNESWEGGKTGFTDKANAKVVSCKGSSPDRHSMHELEAHGASCTLIRLSIGRLWTQCYPVQIAQPRLSQITKQLNSHNLQAFLIDSPRFNQEELLTCRSSRLQPTSTASNDKRGRG